MDWPAWIEAVAAAWTAAFTIVLAIATIRLWNSTKGLHLETKRLATIAEEQSNDMKSSIAAAKKAADAAQRSADAAIGAERAWLLLTIDSDNLEEAVLRRLEPENWESSETAESTNPSVQFHFDNRGKTPAFIREAAMELAISVDIPERVIAEPLAPWWPEEIIIPAGARYPLGLDEDQKPLQRTTVKYQFSDEDAKLFGTKNPETPQFRFWFYGHVIYTDVWNNIHMTRFCLASEVWSGWYTPPESLQYNQRT